MKTRNIHKKQRRHKKSHKRTLRKKYKKGGQPVNYSIPQSRYVNYQEQQEEYIPEEQKQKQEYGQEELQPQQEQLPSYDIAADAGKKVSDAVNQLKEVFNQAAQQVKDTYKKAKDKTLEQLSKVADKAQSAAQDASNKIKNIQAASPVSVMQTPQQSMALNTTSGGRRKYKNKHNLNKTKKLRRH
jgi:ElaB/YqjD/DUF883 family membrane-anchored ribosome-binding protein